MNAQYIYESGLDLDRQEIRLLELGPGSHDDPIKISMKTVSLLDQAMPRYHALSYVWGDARIKEPITLNDCEIWVTRNLHVALQYLRRHSGLSFEPLPIWIDAICINQDDIPERNRQVRRMKDIYGRAEKVLIWLGENGIYESLNMLFDHFRDNRQWPTGPARTEEEATPLFSHYVALCRKDWWSRVWVIQEFVLAKEDPIFICGIKSVTWSNIVKYQGYMDLLGESYDSPDIIPVRPKYSFDANDDGSLPRLVLLPLRLEQLRQEFHQNGSITLSRGLRAVMSIRAQATDERDMIYGLIGLLTPADAASIIVDYEKEPRSIFADAMRYMVARQPLASELLSHLFPMLTFPCCQGYPSWFPDFFTDERRLAVLSVSKRAETLRITNDRVHDWRADQTRISIGRTGEALFLAGVEIDTVSEILHPFVGPDFNGTPVTTLEGIETLVSRGRYKQLNSTAQLVRLQPPNMRGGLPAFVTGWSESRLALCVDSPSREALDPDGDILWKTWLGTTGQATIDARGVTDGRPQLNRDNYKYWEGTITSTHALGVQVSSRLRGREVFITKLGFPGIGTPGMRAGDLVMRPFGATHPFCLRPRDNQDGYTLVGFANLSGFMEASDLDRYYKEGCLKERTFEIY